MPQQIPDNQQFYFVACVGAWAGEFRFDISDRAAFRRAGLGAVNRLLVLGLLAVQKIFGPPNITANVTRHPEWGPAGVAVQDAVISKFGIVLYRVREQYVLNPDGRTACVHARERFGPLPFLFNKQTRHPVVVQTGGRAATLPDMPLLDTMWKVFYEAGQDGDSIDAVLECAWARAVKRTVRRGLKQDFDFAALNADRELRDLNDVLNTLRRYRDRYEHVRNPMAVFTHAYMSITEEFIAQIPTRNFQDREWVIALDIAFAREYFRAMDAHDLGLEIPAGWRKVLEELASTKTSVLEELLVCMAAHIVHDLPLALIAAGINHNGTLMTGDFHRANDVLQAGINKIQAVTAQRYNPALAWLDRVAGRSDEFMTNYGIRIARALAWYNAERLSLQAEHQEAQESIVRSTEMFVDKLLNPPLLSLRIVMRLMRLLSRLTRVWSPES